MYRSESPFVVDFYVVSLRWVLFLCISVSLAVGSRLFESSNLLLLLLGVWNVFLMVVAGQSKRLVHHRWISLYADILISICFFFLNQPSPTTSFLLFLLPITSAGFYFNLKGAVLNSLFFSAILFIRWFGSIDAPLLTIYTLTYGLLFGYISQVSYNEIQKDRLWQIEQREKHHLDETNRIRTIYNLSTTITSMLNYTRVLDSILDLSQDALMIDEMSGDQKLLETPQSLIVSAVLLRDEAGFTIASSRNILKSDMLVTLSEQNELLQQLHQQREPIVITPSTDNSMLDELKSFSNCRSLFCLPMINGYELAGGIIYGHPQEGYFTQAKCDILGIIGQQALVAIQNAKLYQEVSDEKEKIAEAEEETRKKLARDLHDGPTQSVTAIAMRVNLARRLITSDPKRTSEELVKIEELARRTTKEIRHMLFSLRPIILETEGLAAAIYAIGDKIREVYGKKIAIKVDEKLAHRVELNKSGVIFFMIDEAVNNAQKHANAEHISISFTAAKQNSDIICIEIIDDGIGFDLAEVNRSYEKRGSLGLINLRERTEILNGLLKIDSKPERGTKIQIFVPLSETALEYLHHPTHKLNK